MRIAVEAGVNTVLKICWGRNVQLFGLFLAKHFPEKRDGNFLIKVGFPDLTQYPAQDRINPGGSKNKFDPIWAQKGPLLMVGPHAQYFGQSP